MGLVLVAILPAFALLLYDAIDEHRATRAALRNEILTISRQLALGQKELVGATRQLLVTLAQSSEVRDRHPGRCTTLLADVRAGSPAYANLGVASVDGDLVCSALATSDIVNIADRTYFTRAFQTRAFAFWGDYEPGRAPGRPTLNFGYPMADPSGRLTAVVFAALNLRWLEERIQAARLPEGASVAVLDRAATVLAHYPDEPGLVGRPYGGFSVVEALRSRRDGTLEGDGTDGRRRLFAFAPLLNPAQLDGPRVVVSIPTDTVAPGRRHTLLRNLLMLAVAGVAALGLAWVASDRFVLRRIGALVETADRLESGDFTARAGAPYRPGELVELARAIDDMGDAIDRVTAQNRRILEAVGEGISGPERTPVDVNTIAKEAVELLAHQLRVSDIEVVLDLASGLPALWADAHQLHQVLVNLLANARHAMRHTASSRRISIATGLDQSRTRVRVTVSDTGPGIPPEIQPKIFEPFFTTKPAGEGAGLGLSLCRGIVEEHGGTIEVESAPGRGASFVIELPLRAHAADRTGSIAPMRHGTIPPKTILVVDDEADIAATLAEVLRSGGHRVDVASNGAEALALLSCQPYDLVVSDTEMPALDGIALYQELERRFPALADRVIFVTGDVLDRAKRERFERLRVPALTKPCDPVELRRVVARVLGGRRPPGAPDA